MTEDYYVNSKDLFIGEGEVVCSNCPHSLFLMSILNGRLHIHIIGTGNEAIPTICPKCLSPLKWKSGIARPRIVENK